MIRAIHARGILEALARTAEAGPVFDAVCRCVNEVDLIVRTQTVEEQRGRVIEDLEISIRLAHALRAREILTVRELESKTAEGLMKSGGFGKKMLREVRELLASLSVAGVPPLKLKGDP